MNIKSSWERKEELRLNLVARLRVRNRHNGLPDLDTAQVSVRRSGGLVHKKGAHAELINARRRAAANESLILIRRPLTHRGDTGSLLLVWPYGWLVTTRSCSVT